MATIACAECGRLISPEQSGAPCPDCGSLNRQIVLEERGTAAEQLAKMHYAVEDGLTRVFRITTGKADHESPNEPIRLLEVNENTVAAGIMPLYFGPAPAIGIKYPSIIVEVTPEEFDRIQARE